MKMFKYDIISFERAFDVKYDDVKQYLKYDHFRFNRKSYSLFWLGASSWIVHAIHFSKNISSNKAAFNYYFNSIQILFHSMH